MDGQRARYGVLVAAALLLASTKLAVGQHGVKGDNWPTYSGDLGATRYSRLDQITRDNVKNLKVAWVWRSDSFSAQPERRSETTPLMIDGLLYFTAGARRAVVAANAATGETTWIWKNDEGARGDQAPRKGSGRGVAYWSDNGRDARVLTVTAGFRLVALDAKTGFPVAGFGKDGVVDLFEALGVDYDPIGTIGNTSAPVVAHDLVIVGPALAESSHPKTKSNTKGDVMAFDVRTGKKVWAYHAIPRKGEPGYDTWLNNSADYTGNAGVWTPFSVDDELQRVYLPIESPTNEYYGGHRPGDNLFSSSLVCLDLKTGKQVWAQQIVHHDVWDMDIAATPVLMDVTVDGQSAKIVIQPTKQAFAYVYDRVTGKPIWPIEERPVPRSDVPGEMSAPTQPFATRPPAFDRQGLTDGDLIDFTPELHQTAIEILKQYRHGPLFIPGSLQNNPDGTKGTLMLPGNRGGGNWNTGAVDPDTGYFYVVSVTRPTLIAMNKAKLGESEMDYISPTLSRPIPTVEGLPLVKPPYGRITAIDMNTGDIVWQVANGDTPPEIKNHAKLAGMTLPPTGSVSHANLLATKTLLFEGEGDGGQPMFRALDKKTGETIWETQLPGGAMSGLPMTYMYQGKQFIVFSSSGSADPARQTAGILVAYSLP